MLSVTISEWRWRQAPGGSEGKFVDGVSRLGKASFGVKVYPTYAEAARASERQMRAFARCCGPMPGPLLAVYVRGQKRTRWGYLTQAAKVVGKPPAEDLAQLRRRMEAAGLSVADVNSTSGAERNTGYVPLGNGQRRLVCIDFGDLSS